MRIKSKIIIAIGVGNALLHIMLILIDFNGFLPNVFGGYVFIMGVFSSLWVVLQLSAAKQLNASGRFNNVRKSPSLFNKNAGFWTPKYYDSYEELSYITEKISRKINNSDIKYNHISDSEFSLTVMKESRLMKPRVKYRVFEETTKTTLLTSIDYQVNDVIPSIKLLLAILVIVFSYVGIIFFIPAIIIHIYTMVEFSKMGSSTSEDLKMIDGIIKLSI